MSEPSIFTRIINREIPAQIEFEDELCIVIRDINPVAPVHLLIIPKDRIDRISKATDEQGAVLGHLMLVARNMADQLGLDQGFRVVINNGPHACESVPHLHVHLLAERQMKWPPG